MHRILYISTARKVLDPSDLESLLAISRRNNAQAGVTGLLVAGGRRFLQVLEGPADAVRHTFERIEQDPRHFALVTLSDGSTDTRQFEQWSMGFEKGAVAKHEDGLENQVAALIAPLKDRNLQAYFAGFAKSHGSVPAR